MLRSKHCICAIDETTVSHIEKYLRAQGEERNDAKRRSYELRDDSYRAHDFVNEEEINPN